jgi:arylsulfatase A-like enzyme
MRNLLLIVLDTARADSFGSYGAADGATPCFDELAAGGTCPPVVVAPSNWTLPSHASMFTGMLPAALGFTGGTKLGSRTGLNSRPLLEAQSDRVLAQVLRRNGYATAAVSCNPWIHEIHGFATGFEEFVSLQGGARKELGRGIGSKIAWAADAWRSRVDDGATNARDILLGWLENRDARPFFFFVNLMECHSPLLPPRPYNDLPGIERIRAARDAARYQTPQGIYRVCVGELEVEAESAARMQHLYARSIRQMDDWIGSMLGEFSRRGLLDDTIVVIASDHGENLGEDNLIGHELSMHDRLVRVPLAISEPIPTPPLVSLAHLPSLIAGPLGLADHPWHDDPLPGGFAVSQVAGQLLLPERETLARSWGVPEEAIRRIASPMSAATDGRYKLVRDATGERFYDLATDPAEASPATPDADATTNDVARGMRAAIDAVDALAPVANDTAGTSASDESADLEERLRSLGYI